MKPSNSIHDYSLLVGEVKKEIFSDLDNFHAFVSPSAYDTAWLAMIPDDENNGSVPMFENCLKWIVENQREGGFWGATNEDDLPTIDALPATLACLIALNRWKYIIPAHHNITVQAGLDFIHSKAEILLKINYQHLPRWFVLCFPAMIELAEAEGLHLVFPPGLRQVIANIFTKRRDILQMEDVVDNSSYFPPLLSYLETFPRNYQLDLEEIVRQQLSTDGSIFESPSATAQAFMLTKNANSLKYLQSLSQQFPNGAPAQYPIDGDLIKLCMVDHVQGMGLAKHFNDDIEKILAQVLYYRNHKANNKREEERNNRVPRKLFKDAMAFRLLRMHGHYVTPASFCWFLEEPELMAYMEENCEQFISAMYSVYRATDLVFPEDESEMEEARAFATNILQNYTTRLRDHNFLISKGCQNMITYELNVPWIARLDHLYHRKWIEENRITPLWVGKASFYRLSCLDNNKLMQLALENFQFQQSVYRNELEELKGWSKQWRLSEMGFGREKTLYTYFAVASTSTIPMDSIMRLVIAKSAIIVTVADDFYDMEGSLPELEILTDAVKRWDGSGLQGHSKTIFDSLDDLVTNIAANFQPQERTNVLSKLRDIWRRTFLSWMVERSWSLTGYIPTMEEYIETGMISIAADVIALPATSFLSQSSQNEPLQNPDITKLLMAITRLVNDTQSYQKEEVDGKLNLVLLHSMENPGTDIKDSVDYVRRIVEAKRREFIKRVFTNGLDGDMPKACRHVHLSCMKVFQMFFNSSNLFDTETALAEEISKAIYLPIDHKQKLVPVYKPLPAVPTQKKNQVSRISNQILSNPGRRGSKSLMIRHRFQKKLIAVGQEKACIPTKFNLCHIR